MVNEHWRQVPNFPEYEVSSLGRVVSHMMWGLNKQDGPRGGRLLSVKTDKDGYLKVSLTKDGKSYGKSIARLVCEAWHGAPPRGHVARHLDGCRKNNTPDNLAWGSPRDNVHDAIRHGTHPRGTRAHKAKLSDEKAREIFQDKRANAEIALEYGVSPGAIWFIKTKRSWVHACKDLY